MVEYQPSLLDFPDTLADIFSYCNKEVRQLFRACLEIRKRSVEVVKLFL